MARQKVPQSGNNDNTGITLNINAARPAEHLDERPAESEVRSVPRAPEPAQTEGSTEVQRPKAPLYTRDIAFIDDTGARFIAAPLAATVFGRFNPRWTGEQPAEHWQYEDHGVKRRGFI